GLKREIALKTAPVPARAGITVRHERNVPHFSGVSPSAAHHLPVIDDAAAEADAQEQMIEIEQLLPHAVKALAMGRGSAVHLHEGRAADGVSKAFIDVHARPSLHGGGPNEAHGFDIEGAGHGHAHTDEALPRRVRSQLRYHGADAGERLFRGHSRRFDGPAREHLAAKIDEASLKPARRDIHAAGIAPIRVDLENGRGKASPLWHAWAQPHET